MISIDLKLKMRIDLDLRFDRQLRIGSHLGLDENQKEHLDLRFDRRWHNMSISAAAKIVRATSLLDEDDNSSSWFRFKMEDESQPAIRTDEEIGSHLSFDSTREQNLNFGSIRRRRIGSHLGLDRRWKSISTSVRSTNEDVISPQFRFEMRIESQLRFDRWEGGWDHLVFDSMGMRMGVGVVSSRLSTRR